ncbi:hypothetical protein FQA39_LY13474 [Lamprigera yunnana]|nr:hypothetical protein FQA39_LY13474 [Lamprigera yunnana]
MFVSSEQYSRRALSAKNLHDIVDDLSDVEPFEDSDSEYDMASDNHSSDSERDLKISRKRQLINQNASHEEKKKSH